MPPPASFDDVVCLANTELACLIDFGDRELWIPYKCVEDDSEVFEKGDKGTVLVAHWFAVQEGLVEKD